MSKLRTITAGLFLSVLYIFLSYQTSSAFTREDLVTRMQNSQDFFKELASDPETAIPSKLIKKASGIVILRHFKAGAFVGVEGGRGFVMARDEETGEWSPPAFVRTSEGSFGLQVGGQTVNSVYVVMSGETMQKILKGGLKVGVDITGQVGPVGKDVEIELAKEELFVYSKAKGLFAGAAFKAVNFSEDAKANKIFYSKELTADNILYEKAVEMPEEAKSFAELLKNY